ncbi:MAG TPA: hypothetical protein VLQ80_09315, partial [Candidatus Saccharimonadia bacterium]|nr:hypothetical protein [Candidatus Saccharimonadia bacterium]
MSQAIEHVAKTSPRDDKWQSSLSKFSLCKAFQFFDQTALSPLLLLRDAAHGKVIIADGYHR